MNEQKRKRALGSGCRARAAVLVLSLLGSSLMTLLR